MNLANELDLAFDEAVKRQIGRLFDTYLMSKEPPETKTNQLKAALKVLEGDVDIATAALDDL